MDRRTFVKNGLAAGAAAGAVAASACSATERGPSKMSTAAKFKLKYAPNVNAFWTMELTANRAASLMAL